MSDLGDDVDTMIQQIEAYLRTYLSDQLIELELALPGIKCVRWDENRIHVLIVGPSRGTSYMVPFHKLSVKDAARVLRTNAFQNLITFAKENQRTREDAHAEVRTLLAWRLDQIAKKP